ncbi:RagB/SusD family nutrient uptake outer membrane protein [Ekhidna sp.]|uniref:RagB/SusD family nutrient uptake outer membrane protein n=1 Tax=Ekhidna sp. TaxID=2608089 RepID=UPI003B500A95
MKNIKILSTLFAFLIMFSCEDKLELQPAQSLSVSESLGDLDGLFTGLIGAYDELQDVNYYGRDQVVINEVRADNVYISINNSNRFLNDFRYEYRANATQLAFWGDAYSLILRVNNILQNIDAAEGTQTDKDQIAGEALFLRAITHFDLVKTFALPYGEGAGNPGVPVMLEPSISEPARNTVGEVYAQVIADLIEAKNLITEDNGPYRATDDACDALLARVYLYMEDYANAEASASAVIGAGYTLFDGTDLATFWGTHGTSEEIFTIRRLANETLGSDNLGQIFNPQGYGDIRVSNDLINVYEAGDRRAAVDYYNQDGFNWVGKYLSQEGNPGLTNNKVFRLAEMYLIRAEARLLKASPDAAGALADLDAVRTRAGLPSAGTATLAAIKQERRVELAFEGHRALDIFRWGDAVTRIACGAGGTGDELNAPCFLAADSPLRIYPIPQQELDVNQNMTQNPGY